MRPTRPLIEPSRHRLCVALLALACLPATAGPKAEHWNYTVLPGDTLIGIAQEMLRRPQDWRALQRINKVSRPRFMQQGRVLQIPLDWLHPEASVAQVAALVGTVTVHRPGSPAVAVREGDTLQARDQLRTGEDSSITVELADGSRILVAPQSDLTLLDLSRLRGIGSGLTTLELQQGSVESDVREQAPRPRFEIRTPVMTLGVRGTQFRAHADHALKTARAEVTQGSVAAQAAMVGAPIVVNSGFGVVGSAGAIEAPVALLGAPDLSMVPARIERLPLQFAWPQTSAERGWRAQVFDADGRLWRDRRFPTAAAQWSELPDGAYRLRVRAVDARGLEGQESTAPFTLKARPEPPVTLAPKAHARLYGPTALWRWSLSSAAASYRLQVSDREDFASAVITREGLTEAAIELPLAPGRWWWRMGSVRADGDQGPWGDAQVFDLREVPPAPSKEPPAIDKDRLSLRWSARLPDDRYRFQIAHSADFANLLIDQTVSSPGAELPLPAAGRYWLRVRTLDADGEAGPWGAPSLLEVPSQSSPWIWLGPILFLLMAL